VCTVKSVRPSSTDGAHRVGPSGLLRKTDRSQSTFSSINRPRRSAAYAQLEGQCFAAYAQLARQTLALCASGVQTKMRPGVYGCRQPRQRGFAAYAQLASTLKSPMATCGGAAQIQLRTSTRRVVKSLIPRKMETPRLACAWS
jgi:hypothetical protein